MPHHQAPDPWAHLKQRPRRKLVLDFGEKPVARKRPRKAPKPRPLWKVALEARRAGR